MEKINIKLVIIISIFILIIFIYVTFFSEVKKIDYEVSNDDVIENNNILEVVDENKDIKKDIFVEIKGAVNTPGVYKMDADSRVIDVVNVAGGFREDANTRYINLSKKVKDEMNIIIYTNDEINNSKESKVVVIEKECVCPEVKNDACLEKDNDLGNPGGLVSLNTATLDELLTIPGIGEAKAKSIIEYRENNKFSTTKDIMNVKGIGEALFESIKEYITV